MSVSELTTATMSFRVKLEAVRCVACIIALKARVYVTVEGQT